MLLFSRASKLGKAAVPITGKSPKSGENVLVQAENETSGARELQPAEEASLP